MSKKTGIGEYTATEQRIMDKLQSGGICSRAMLQTCLMDNLAGPTSLVVHLTRIRKKLPPGLVILHLRNGAEIWGWQLMRDIGRPE